MLHNYRFRQFHRTARTVYSCFRDICSAKSVSHPPRPVWQYPSSPEGWGVKMGNCAPKKRDCFTKFYHSAWYKLKKKSKLQNLNENIYLFHLWNEAVLSIFNFWSACVIKASVYQTHSEFCQLVTAVWFNVNEHTTKIFQYRIIWKHWPVWYRILRRWQGIHVTKI